MSLLKAPDLVGVIGVGPAITHFAGLWHPEIHAPGHSNGRIGVSGRQGMLGLRTYQRADILNIILGSQLPRNKNKEKYFFHFKRAKIYNF
ncbi:hypothetical protein D9M70_615580 [compost metagenome]